MVLLYLHNISSVGIYSLVYLYSRTFPTIYHNSSVSPVREVDSGMQGCTNYQGYLVLNSQNYPLGTPLMVGIGTHDYIAINQNDHGICMVSAQLIHIIVKNIIFLLIFLIRQFLYFIHILIYRVIF